MPDRPDSVQLTQLTHREFLLFLFFIILIPFFGFLDIFMLKLLLHFAIISLFLASSKESISKKLSKANIFFH